MKIMAIDYGDAHTGIAISYYTLNEALRDAFDKHGVEMTYDHLNVHLVPESGKAEQQS